MTVTHDLKSEKTFYTNRIISLNVGGSDRPVQFYPFAVFNHLVYHISTKNALLVVDYIQQAYNDKFNSQKELICLMMKLLLEEKLSKHYQKNKRLKTNL